jgi:hypothetical protein
VLSLELQSILKWMIDLQTSYSVWVSFLF